MVEAKRLTAEALGITQVEHDALIAFRDEVLPTLVHDADQIIPQGEAIDGKTKGLNMSIVLNKAECGTTACIAGWMHVIMTEKGVAPQGNAFQYGMYERSRPLGSLFCPFTDSNGNFLVDAHGLEIDVPYEIIDTDVVKGAIDNFLTTGDPDYQSLIDVY